MKKQFIITVIFTIIFLGNSYCQGKSKKEISFKHLKRTSLKYKPAYNFQEQLSDVVIASFQINEGLRLKDSQQIRSGVLSVIDNLIHINENNLSNKAHYPWYLHKMKMGFRLKRIYNSNNLESQKIYFDEFNRELYKSIKSYGLKKKKFYYQSCLVALDHTGGYWFSDSPSIRNPYLEKSNQKCGFIAEILK